MTKQRNARHSTLRSISAGLCVLFMSSLLTSGSARTAEAQPTRGPEARGSEAVTSTPADAVTVSDTVTSQELAQMLTSPIAEKRSRAFHLVTDFAYRSPEVDLNPLVPTLVGLCKNDPDEKYRLAAVSALHALGDERGMEQLRQRFAEEPSLRVQFMSVRVLLDYYGADAFADDVEAATIANSVLARRREVVRLAKRQRLTERRRLRMWPRVTAGPLEVVDPDSLR